MGLCQYPRFVDTLERLHYARWSITTEIALMKMPEVSISIEPDVLLSKAAKGGEKFDGILDEAAHVVNGPRRHYYGHPYENHGCTALLLSAWFERRFGFRVEFTRRDVCMINILQKVSRDCGTPSHDNLVDIAGWAENAHICEGGPPSFDGGVDGKIED